MPCAVEKNIAHFSALVEPERIFLKVAYLVQLR